MTIEKMNGSTNALAAAIMQMDLGEVNTEQAAAPTGEAGFGTGVAGFGDGVELGDVPGLLTRDAGTQYAAKSRRATGTCARR